jgi:hypothetical protein
MIGMRFEWRRRADDQSKSRLPSRILSKLRCFIQAATTLYGPRTLTPKLMGHSHTPTASQGDSTIGGDNSSKSLLWTSRPDDPPDSAEARQLWSVATKASTHSHSHSTCTGMMPNAFQGETAELGGLSGPKNHDGQTTTRTDIKSREELELDEVAAGKSILDARRIEDMAMEKVEPEEIIVCSRSGTDKWVVIESPAANEQGEHGTNGITNGTDVGTIESTSLPVEWKQGREELSREESAFRSRGDVGTDSPGEPQAQHELSTFGRDSQAREDELSREDSKTLSRGDVDTESPCGPQPQQELPTSPDKLDAGRGSGQYLWAREHTTRTPRSYSSDDRSRLLREEIVLDTRLIRKLDRICRLGGESLSMRVRLAERRQELKNQRSDLRNSIAKIVRVLGEGLAKARPGQLGDFGDLKNLFNAVQEHNAIVGPSEERYDEFEDQVDQADYRLRKLEKAFYADICERFRDAGASPSVPLRSIGNADDDSSYASGSDNGLKLDPLEHAYLSRVGDANLARERLANLEHNYWRVLEEQKIRSPYGIELSKENTDFLEAYPSDRAQLEMEIRDLNIAVEELRQKCIEVGLIERDPPPPPLPPLLPPLPPPLPHIWPRPPPPPPLLPVHPQPPQPPPPPLLLYPHQPQPPPPQQWEQSQLQQLQPQLLQEAQPLHTLPPTPETLPATMVDDRKPPSQIPQLPKQRSQYGDHLITSFSSTRDRINRWLLDILTNSRIEKSYYRSFLSNNPSISNLQWESLFDLLVECWPTDSAAIGDPISPTRSLTASRRSSIASDDNTTTGQQYSTVYTQPGGAAKKETVHRPASQPTLTIDTTPQPPRQLVSERMALPSLTEDAGGLASSHFFPQGVPAAPNGRGVYVKTPMDEDLNLLGHPEPGFSPNHHGRNSHTPDIYPPSLDSFPGASEDVLHPSELLIRQWDSGYSPQRQFSPWSSPMSGKTYSTW